MTTAVAPATIVLVHGAWHGPWCFNKVVAGLEERGVPVVNVERRRLHEPSVLLRSDMRPAARLAYSVVIRARSSGVGLLMSSFRASRITSDKGHELCPTRDWCMSDATS